MTNELYLILHKVRSEPAFDIAQKIEVGKEEGWIIPTSGHRAYPVQTWALSMNGVPEIEDAYSIPDIPPDLPDHYDVKRDDNSHLVNTAREILTRKGLISAPKPSQPTFRRL
jgi:hypothetical protein